MLFSLMTLRRRHVLSCVSVLLAAVAVIGTAMADTLTGTAVIRERIALPPDAVFEAVIEDSSRADAPARPLARIVIDGAGQSPIAFAIDYDPADLDPRAVYALRATLRHDGQLLFTTDTATPVLQDGEAQTVEVVMKRVQGDRSGAAAPKIGAHGLRLPATFRGTLPCADCEGIRHHLDLWPRQYYHMRREWLKADETRRRDEIGRWYADPLRGAIVLQGASEMPLFWQVEAPDRLRQMDMAGNPITSELDYALTSDDTLEPAELAGLFLLGRMTHMGDAARFEECFSGVRYPIAQGGDYDALERAYLEAAPTSGAPVVVHVQGGLAPRPTPEGALRTSLIVDRFIATRPGDTCAKAEPQASLTDTYWRFDRLMGQEVRAMQNRREPHIVLYSDPERRFRATVGCNRILGRHDQDGETLTLAVGASTRMACPPPLDTIEQALLDMLAATRSFRLQGQSLELQDAEGGILAELSAVYLR